MHKKFAILSFSILTAIVVLSLNACSDDSPTKPEPQPDVNVSGFVVKGPVQDASVEIRALSGDGSPGDLVVDAGLTDSDGTWSAVIPGDTAGSEFLVVATEGNYLDESDGERVTIPTGSSMVGFFNRSRPTSVVVTPYTHMLYLMARESATDFGAVRSWESAIENASADNSFGFDLTSTVPSTEAGATVDQLNYAALLGGLTLATDLEIRYTPFAGTNPFEMAMSIAADLTDGTLDGKDAGGDDIEVRLGDGGVETQALPGINGEGVDDLVEWSLFFADGDPRFDLPPIVILPPTPGPISCDQLPVLRNAARANLENTFFATLNGPEAESPRDVDFGTARGLYNDVLACDATDVEAHLSMALLDMLTLTLDADVNDAFDEWEAYLDAMVPFETDAPAGRLSVPTGLSNPKGALELPFDAIYRSLVPYLSLGRAVAPPQIADVQDIFRNKVIPRVQSAIEHMDEVVDDPNWTYTISARMQGDVYAQDRLADHTDFLGVRAGLKALEAGLRIAISYRVNLNDYTGAELVSGLDQTSGTLLTLQGDGATQMQSVPGILAGAAADLEAAINSLLDEVGTTQTNHLIIIGPDDLSADELIEFRNTELAMIQESLAGPMTRVYDWDFNGGTPDQSMTVDIAAFFADPIVDFKDLVPPYSLSLDIVPYDVDYRWEDSYPTISVTAPEAGSFYGYYGVNYYDYMQQSPSFDGPEWVRDELAPLVDAEVARITSIEDWGGELNVQASVWHQYTAGTQDVQVELYVSYEIATSFVEVVTVTFAADTYEEWLEQWPNPTLNGLFPNVTAARLNEVFNLSDMDWTKRFRLDWAGSFGFENVPVPPVLPIGGN